MSHFTLRVAEGVLRWRLAAMSFSSSLFCLWINCRELGVLRFPVKNMKSSRRTNCSECSSPGVTVQTEEKQVAVITAYRLNTGLKYKWSSGLGCWKELLYQDPLLCSECFRVGSWTKIDHSTSSSGWLEIPKTVSVSLCTLMRTLQMYGTAVKFWFWSSDLLCFYSRILLQYSRFRGEDQILIATFR